MASFLGYCCTPFGRRLNTALPHKMASFLEISTELLIQIYEELSVEEAQIFLGQRQSDLVRTHKFQQVGLSILLVNKSGKRDLSSTGELLSHLFSLAVTMHREQIATAYRRSLHRKSSPIMLVFKPYDCASRSTFA